MKSRCRSVLFLGRVLETEGIQVEEKFSGQGDDPTGRVCGDGGLSAKRGTRGPTTAGN